MRVVAIPVLLALGIAVACSKADPSAAQTAARTTSTVPSITVAAVANGLAAGAVVPVDANGDKTRNRLGVVPGAVLLSDYELYSLSELPADKAKTLVFYCANTQCTASHEAARRARFAGHTSVKVMDEGIAGWIAAGHQVQTL